MICAFDASADVPTAVRLCLFSMMLQNMCPASLCLFLPFIIVGQHVVNPCGIQNTGREQRNGRRRLGGGLTLMLGCGTVAFLDLIPAHESVTPYLWSTQLCTRMSTLAVRRVRQCLHAGALRPKWEKSAGVEFSRKWHTKLCSKSQQSQRHILLETCLKHAQTCSDHVFL